MREHAGRVISALFALPCLYAVVRYAPPPVFAGVIALVVVLAQYELYRMVLGVGRPRSEDPFPLAGLGLGMAFGAGLIMALYSPSRNVMLPFLVTALVMSAGAVSLRLGHELRAAFVHAAAVVFGVGYVAWLLGHFVLLRGLPGGEWWVLWVLWVTWIGDGAAYYVGRAVGGRPLAPRISPKKTVSGGIGGVVGSAAAAVIGAAWFVDGVTWLEAGALGVGMGILGMIGDLVESMIKRSSGVKDSGNLIPWHGGILDKIDGLLFTAPMLYYYLVLVKGSGAPGMIAWRPG